MIAKILLTTIIFYSLILLGIDGAKICYQCDEKNPSSRFKFWGEKITRCSDTPFEKYATKTSTAFGTSVLTCYTKFDATGAVIKRDAYGLGETFDKKYKCRDRYHTCCRSNFCNKHSQPPCPPPADAQPKQEVKACYQCNGPEACRPEKLDGTEIRTSGAFGGKNLYCYTKFHPKTGVAIARGAFGFGEFFDKSFKCDAKNYLCCYENLCNKHTVGFCDQPHQHY